MAIFHLAVKTIARGSGRSSVGAAAYRSGERLVNRQSGAMHDFGRKQGIDSGEVLLPAGAPSWMQNRQELWNAVEVSETRSNSRTARELVIALPRELTPGEQVQLLRGYLVEEFVSRGMVADFNIHDTHTGNPHAHVMLTTREVSPFGFRAKVRAWDKVELLQEWREAWADHCNAALADSGCKERVDHRTLFMQGIDREPTRHHGIPGKLYHRYAPEQPVTPPTVHPPAARTARQAAQDFDTAFLAALSKPIGRAELSDMDTLNARTGRQQGQGRL